MRLTRVIWALLALALVVVLAATWALTRPGRPEPSWVGAVSVLSGDGRDGWRDGSSDDARFSEPFGLAAAPDGRIFVSDAGSSHRIRQIAADGTVTTVAGGERGFRDGRGARARFATPSHIALAPDGSLVVADTGNHAIRRVALDGVVTTIAGDGVAGFVDGPARQSRFNGPVGVAVDATGRIIVADTYNDRIRVIDPDGQVRTLAGGADADGRADSNDGRARPPGAAGLRDGPGPEARFDTPCGVAVDANNRILVADTGNGLIRAIQPDGVVSTVVATAVALVRPMALAVGASGDVHVADEGGQIVVLPVEGDARVLAGGSVSGFADGVGSEARFRRPSSLALVGPALRAGQSPAASRLVVADAGNALVRAVPMPEDRARLKAPISATMLPPMDRWWPWADVELTPPSPPGRAPAFDAEAFARTPLFWPVSPLEGPHEVAGTFGEARGGAGQERFHAGLDVRENQGTPVRAVRDGIVASPIATFAFETLNEGVRIGDLAYIHIRVGRTRAAADLDLQRFAPVYDVEGVMTRMRAKRGAFFTTGDEVGTVNAFNHVHLNVGWSGEEYNPLRFGLLQFTDGISPSIAPAGVRLFDEAWTPLNPDRLGPMRGRGRKRRPTRLPPLEPVVVRGRVRIVVDAWDQADGNKAYRRLGLYAVGYTVAAETAADRTLNAERRTQVFDRMRREADAAKRVYATGSGIPVYGASRTQFLYVATTSYQDGIATEGFWDTRTVAPGEHVLRVFVQDFSGNTTSRDLRVIVVP